MRLATESRQSTVAGPRFRPARHPARDDAPLTVRLKRPLAAQALLFVGLLGALGSFSYDQLSALAPLPLLCVAALFFGLALSTPFDSRWAKRVLVPALALLGFVLTYAYVFTLRTDAPMLPSVLSQRQYVYLLLGPVVYMLYVRGWRLRDFQQVFLAAVLLTVLGLAAFDVIFSPRSLLLSGTFFQLQLGEVTEQSSIFRLVNTSALFLLVYLGRRLFQIGDALLSGLSLATVTLCSLLVAITLPRGLLTSILAALIVYALFLSRPERAKLSLVVLPLYGILVAISLPFFSSAFVETFGQDRTYLARVRTADTAWRYFLEYPVFGFGSDSAQTVSFQYLFGAFFPSDIGLLGVAFQFGLVGLALYLFLSGWLCLGLLRLLWAHAGRLDPKHATFLWTLFVICLSFLIASPLQAKFIYGTGLPIGAFAWGLLMAHGHGLSRTPEKTAPPRQSIASPTAGSC